MNKKIIVPLAILPIIIAVTLLRCKTPKRITIDQVHAIEDSIPHLFPTASMIHTNQNEDYNEVNLIITDAALYSATPQQMQAAAIRSGVMLLHVLGADNSISKGTLVITKQTSTNDGIPADGIKMDMKIDSLAKVATSGK